MKAVAEPQEGNKVKLAVEIDEAEFEKAVDAAFRKIAFEVRVPGFRPGKVPRRILESRIGSEAARQQAMQDSLPEFYVQALEQTDTDAISSPELNITGGAESGPVTFDAVVEVRPRVSVPGYGGLQVTVPSPAVSESDVDAQIDRMRNGFAALNDVDRAAVSGDSVRIDVAGSIDGEAISGLTATDYVYEVGSGRVVPELDAQLVGTSAGTERIFFAPVPGQVGQADEAEDRKVIDFRVEVKAVLEKVLPDADDSWAKEASEFATIAELRADLAQRMGQVKKMQSYMALRDATLGELVALVSADTVPDTLVNAEIQRRIDDLAHRLQHESNATIAQYLEATGTTQDELIEQFRSQGGDAVKADLALRHIAEAEALDATEADVGDEIVKLSERVKMKPNQVRKNIERNRAMGSLIADIRKNKALRWLMENVQLVDEDGKTIDRSALELSEVERNVVETQLADDDDSHDQHDHDDEE